MEEILARDFDSEVVFERGERGEICSYKTGLRVVLQIHEGRQILTIE